MTDGSRESNRDPESSFLYETLGELSTGLYRRISHGGKGSFQGEGL